ncbi:MAG: site-2 protease family protein [Ruthenibacterium sp.]
MKWNIKKETERIMDWNLVATYVARALALLLAIPVHESAHAWAADKLGDSTAKNYGRLSLNPLHHFDPLGALCMIFVGFGWAKPVPIAATSNFKNPKRDMALSAAAGPVSNLILAFVFMILYKCAYYGALLGAPQMGYTAGQGTMLNFLFTMLSTMVSLNVTLAVFNLLPIPPLDGSRIAALVLPQRLYFGMMRYERYVMLALFAVLFLGLLDAPLSFLTHGAWTLLLHATGFVELLFGIA